MKRPEKPGLYRGVPEHEYRAWDAVNQSRLKIVHEQSPAHARYDQLHPTPSTPAQVLGNAIHAVLLEPGTLDSRFIARPEGIDGRTGPGKQALEALRSAAAGREIIHQHEYDKLTGIKESVLACEELLDALTSKASVREASFLWKDDKTGLWCKGRLDLLAQSGGRSVVYDLKSTTDASPSSVVRDVVNYGYHVQASFYLEGLSAIAPADRDYVLAFVEKEPPHAVALYRLDDILLEHGRRIWQRSLDRWAECLTTGIYPAYEGQTLDAPEWVAREVGAAGYAR